MTSASFVRSGGGVVSDNNDYGNSIGAKRIPDMQRLVQLPNAELL
jgi:hypothetical protein